jgi:transcriptional regulator with XRE-family HTH domain/SOS-response transcriptional repressor LexA
MEIFVTDMKVTSPHPYDGCVERPTFASALKAARLAAGLSQGGLAERAELTAPYVSLLESGRRRPPRPPLIERLAHALGLAPSALLDLAALERTPGPIRAQLEGMDRERSRVHRARDRMLSTTLFHLARNPEAIADLVHGTQEAGLFRGALGRVGTRLKAVGSAKEARARSHELLDPLPSAERDRLLEALPDVLAMGASPAGAAPAVRAPSTAPNADEATAPPLTLEVELRASLAADAPATERIHVDARWARPGTFLWRLGSDDAWPRLEAGDLLLVDPRRAPRDGDLVALQHEGRELVRVLRLRDDGEVRLEALRPEIAPLRLPARPPTLGVVVHALRTF